MMLRLAPIVGLVLLLAVWEILVRALNAPSFVVAPPSAIFGSLVSGWSTLAPAAAVTAGLAVQALAFASAIGVGLAVLFHKAPLIDRALSPVALVLQATPVIAIAPLVLIWVGIDHPRTALLILAAIVAFFPVFATAYAGFKSVDPGLERLFTLYRASAWRKFVLLELPSAAPSLAAGLKTAAGLSLVGVVVAEFVAGTGGAAGLAWRIVEAGNRLDIAGMFAALFLLGAIGYAFAAAVGALERWVQARSRP
jgi:NitT/TauT family transport system permease protein